MKDNKTKKCTIKYEKDFKRIEYNSHLIKTKKIDSRLKRIQSKKKKNNNSFCRISKFLFCIFIFFTLIRSNHFYNNNNYMNLNVCVCTLGKKENRYIK